MKIVIIGSGSKGNCTFIQSNDAKILIDAGISLLQIRKRLEQYHLNLDNLQALFITHEHTDHIKHMVSILKKNPTCELYIDKLTYKESERKLGTSLKEFTTHFINQDTIYSLNDIDVVPISLSHDVVNCFGYLVREFKEESNYSSFASLTDTGYVPKEYYKVLSQMNTLLIESNYDTKMLKTSGRPIDLINRILSDEGHLSNVDTSKFLKKIYNESIKQVILGHISEECNIPSIAINEVEKAFDQEVPFELFTAMQHDSIFVETKNNK